MVEPHAVTACWWYIIHCNVLAFTVRRKLVHNPGCGCSRRKEKRKKNWTNHSEEFFFMISLSSDWVRVRPCHLLGSGYHVVLATAGGGRVGGVSWPARNQWPKSHNVWFRSKTSSIDWPGRYLDTVFIMSPELRGKVFWNSTFETFSI